LLTDPPVLSRLLWREPMRPGALLSQDRALIARTYGSIFLVGAAIDFLILLVGESTDRNDTQLAVISTIAALLGVSCIVGYRRLPLWYFQILTVAGTLIVTGAVASSSHGAEGVYALFYVWVSLLSGLFFSVRASIFQIAVALAAYAFVLSERDADFAINYLLAAAAVLFTAGTIIAMLRGRVERLAADLSSQAHTDPLTALANRRGFDERFALEVKRASRSGAPLSLVICDLDRFKAVNDKLGHAEGDTALRRTSAAIVTSVRSVDAVSRIGGEEFSVLLPETGPAEALEIAERVRTGILGEFCDYPVALSASCGVATLSDGEQAAVLFREADAGLYRAKRNGRNCSVAYDDSMESPDEASSTK
jgi:diguanylate cyclase (GGDEF)-like protein